MQLQRQATKCRGWEKLSGNGNDNGKDETFINADAISSEFEFDVGYLKTENGDGDEDKKAGDVGFSSENVWVNYK